MKKNVKIPSKKTINLLFKRKTLAHPTRLIPILLLIALVSYAIAQFAVINRLEQVKQAEAELLHMQEELAAVKAIYADYDEVKAEYNRYTYQNYDRSIPNRLSVLAMLERRVFNVCTAQSLSISQRTVSMTLGGLSLEANSELIAGLKEEPMVEDVFVSTTSSTSRANDGSDVTSTVTSITISLKDPTTIQPEAPAAEAEQPENAGGEE